MPVSESTATQNSLDILPVLQDSGCARLLADSSPNPSQFHLTQDFSDMYGLLSPYTIPRQASGLGQESQEATEDAGVGIHSEAAIATGCA